MGILNDMNKGCPESKFDVKWDQKNCFRCCLIVEGESVKSVEGKLFHTRTGKLMFDGGFVRAPRFPCRDLYILTDVETIWCFW